MMGPFDTEREASAAAHAVIPPAPGRVVLTAAQNRQVLDLACAAALVELGAYDARVTGWLAGYEDAMCAVVAGLITRAHAAGGGLTAEGRRTVLDALSVAAEHKKDLAANCGDCGGYDRACPTCESRLGTAAAYDALAGKLAGGAS